MAKPHAPAKRSLPAARLFERKIRVGAATLARVKHFALSNDKKDADAWRSIIFAGLQALNVPAAA